MQMSRKLFLFLLVGALGGHVYIITSSVGDAKAAEYKRLSTSGGGGEDCTANCTFTGTTTTAALAATSVASTGAVSGTTGAFSGTVTSSVASGSNAYAGANGARWAMGPSAYLNSDGAGTSVQYSATGTHQFYGGMLQAGGVTTGVAVRVTQAGRLEWSYTDDSATPGARTINKGHGCVSVASGVSSVVVTNSLVATTSTVFVNLQDNTDAINVRSVVPAAGSFTINLTGNTSAARKVCFLVVGGI